VPGQCEVVQDLCFVGWRECGDGFDFDDDVFEADEVDLVEPSRPRRKSLWTSIAAPLIW